jgi:DNA polymerase I-like protein with 3'-5' exonuclease and polymerase domains
MASNMEVSVEECKSILDSFFKMFPKVKEFTAQNEKTAKEIGYVEDYMGRRRHLPDAQKSEIEVRAKKDVVTNADICMNVELEDCRVEIPDEEKIKEWTKKWQEAEASGRFDAKKKFKEEAKHNNIDLMDNGAFISKTMTQCTNARIQGSAASLTKKAMGKIHNDEQLRELGFKILIPVHDELLGECPRENAEQVEKRLSQLMIEAGKPECSVKMKVDTYVVKHWYQDEVNNIIFEKYQQYINGNPKKNIAPISEEEAIKKICESYPELLEKTVRAICNQTFDVLSEEI